MAWNGAWPGAWQGFGHGAGPGAGPGAGRALAPGGAGGGGGVERSAGEGTGGWPRGGSESPDRRLPPAVGPRRASAPVSGSGGGGCRPSVLPGGQPGSRRAAARAWRGRRAARRLRAARTLRVGRAGAALHRAPRAASRSACVRGPRPSWPGRQDHPGPRPGLPFVAAVRTFVL